MVKDGAVNSVTNHIKKELKWSHISALELKIEIIHYDAFECNFTHLLSPIFNLVSPCTISGFYDVQLALTAPMSCLCSGTRAVSRTRNFLKYVAGHELFWLPKTCAYKVFGVDNWKLCGAVF